MIKKFISYYKPHMKLFIIDMICAFVVSLCNLFYPFITKNIINVYVPNKQIELMLVWLGVLLVIYIVKALLNFVIQYWGHIVGVRIQGDMRKDMFKHLQKLPFSYYDETKTGTIMSRMVNDLMEIAELAHHGPEDIFLSLITIIGATIMIGTINIWLALIFLCVIPFIVLFGYSRRKKQMAAFRETRAKVGEINANVESAISGIRVSKAYTAADHEIHKFYDTNAQFEVARAKAYKQMGIFGSGMNFLIDFLYFVVLLAGGLFFYFGLIDTGDLTAYLLYISMVITPIRTFVTIFETIQNGMTGFARFQDVMDVKQEHEAEKTIELENIQGKIEFKDVSFKYESTELGLGKPNVIENLSMTINPGKTVALVGASGSGKTTLCHLIPRFYEVQDGSIFIDDIDIKDVSRYSLRKNIGIVAQDVFLFAGTIKENIAYGNLDASEEEIIEAAKRAKIHDFIMSLEDGYDTYVGERGLKLSGGQKQRVSIARLFLKNPPILILDEATSALDNMTEMQIQESLEELSKGRTRLVVAHRLSTVKNADEIIVLTKDGIKERGTHEELMEINGIYANLYQYQFKD